MLSGTFPYVYITISRYCYVYQMKYYNDVPGYDKMLLFSLALKQIWFHSIIKNTYVYSNIN